jgi:hypothetical protein
MNKWTWSPHYEFNVCKSLVELTLGLYETSQLAEDLVCVQDSDGITSAMYAWIK